MLTLKLSNTTHIINSKSLLWLSLNTLPVGDYPNAPPLIRELIYCYQSGYLCKTCAINNEFQSLSYDDVFKHVESEHKCFYCIPMRMQTTNSFMANCLSCMYSPRTPGDTATHPRITIRCCFLHSQLRVDTGRCNSVNASNFRLRRFLARGF